MQKKKIRIGIIFGGRSAEHEVSLVSATSIINALDKKKYEIIQIGITKDGNWYSGDQILEMMKSQNFTYGVNVRCVSLTGCRQSVLAVDGPEKPLTSDDLDVVFPVLHGSFGEDGTIQGLFEMANIPYVGAGVLGSSVGMDKVITKQLCEHYGIKVSPYLWFLSKDFRKNRGKLITRIESKVKYPCFVKPANSGSSVGISKAHNRKELNTSINLAMKYDRKILVEQSIENAREIEVSVLGNDSPIASLPGEIISSNEFYDYNAKYVDGKSEAVIPAQLPKSIANKVRKIAVKSYIAIDCSGMARVDFLITKRTNQIYLNELNTIPGFTSISMYPKLWEISGIKYTKLLDRLIQLALERHKEKLKLRTSFKPKNQWYK